MELRVVAKLLHSITVTEEMTLEIRAQNLGTRKPE